MTELGNVNVWFDERFRDDEVDAAAIALSEMLMRRELAHRGLTEAEWETPPSPRIGPTMPHNGPQMVGWHGVRR